jgi:hypothetical protein
MDSIKTHTLVFSILLIFIAISCNISIKKFDLSKYDIPKYKKSELVDLNKIKPLKKEWPELYRYLKKGHLQIVTFKPGRIETLHSNQFYKFLNNNVSMIYKTPFLQDYDNVISTFANEEDAIYFDEVINLPIWLNVVDKICKTCDYSGIGLLFDKKTKKLMTYGKINDINDWK